MVIVETIALSTMVCNDLVMPVLLRLRRLRLNERSDLTGLLLGIRRGAIVGILLLGYLYFRLAGEAYALVSIGLISFAAVAQFAPVVLGGIFWKGGTRRGALAGLGAGFAVWFYTLLLPALARSGWLPIGFLEQGPFGIELLKPLAAVRTRGARPDHARDDLEHDRQHRRLRRRCRCRARRAPTSTARRACSSTCSSSPARRAARASGAARPPSRTCTTCWRASRASRPRRARSTTTPAAHGLRWPGDALVADAEFVHYVEIQLAGAIGAASARIMVASVVKEEALTLEEVRKILDEASQVVVYSHRLEQKSRELEAATAELRAANERLKELDRLKDDFVSTVTHELRTPLTSIRAFSEILHDNPDVDLAQRRKFLGIITKETERLTRLINQVLDLAKIESGRAEWQRVAGRHARDDRGHGGRDEPAVPGEATSRLEARLPERVPPVRADRRPHHPGDAEPAVQRGQVLRAGDGRVEIALAEDDAQPARGRARQRPRHQLPPTRRSSSTSSVQAGDTLTDKPQGSGLGLHISRHIVEHLGGRLWVQSRPGEGACFSFTLPLGRSARAAAAGTGRLNGVPHGEQHGKESPDRRRRAEHRHRARVPAAEERLRGDGARKTATRR